MSGKNCPNCSKDIGIMAIVKAGLPSRMKCPHCRTSVLYKPFPWVFTTFLVILFFIILITLIPVTYIPSFESLSGLAPFVRIMLIGLLWLPFEVILGLYIRKKCQLVLKYNK